MRSYDVRLNSNLKTTKKEEVGDSLDSLEENDYVFFVFALEMNAFKNLDMYPRL